MVERSGMFSEDVTKPETTLLSSDRRLLVFSPTGVVSHPLVEGRYTIGRSVEADVQVDDPALSRLHLAIEVSGSRLSVSDLDSSNGTRLRGETITANRPQNLEIGDLIDVGHSTLVVQTGATLGEPRRVWSHGHYELRLEEECVRARAAGEEFAVVRVRTSEIPAQAAEGTITTLLGAQDMIARYAPGEYELLLSNTGPAKVDEAVGGIRFGLSRLGGTVSVGVACFPRDGQDPSALSGRAGEAARGRDDSSVTRQVDGEPIIVSKTMQRLYELADRVAASDISVLILGETGVGKEILANNLHKKSKRSERPFVPLNCGAFTEQLLESELFGHERGAFTGAVKMKRGLLESAAGGTVFLDEVGEMSLATQVKLLRVLEERQVRRVGSVEPTPIDVRIVAATNRDLEQQVKGGSFREDLFYRLNGISLVVPPLRSRRDEIPAFVEAFAVKTATREKRPAPRFSERAVRVLTEYAWPGNVRELKNVVERAVILAGDGVIDLEHLPMEKLSSSVIFTSTQPVPEASSERAQPVTAKTIPPISASETVEVQAGSLKDEVEELERARIVAALEDCGGNQSRAAKALGMSRKALLRRLDLYDIPRPRKGR